MAALLERESIEVAVDDAVSLRELDQDPEAVWSFLLYAGYLTAEQIAQEPTGHVRLHVRIPNREVRGTYLSLFSRWLGDQLGNEQAADELIQALLGGNTALFQTRLAQLVIGRLSCHDAGGKEAERTYHAFLIGLLARLEGRFDVRSNRESGHGRADILILPRSAGEPGVQPERQNRR